MAVGSLSSVGLVLFWFAWGGLFGSSDVTPLPEDPVVAQIAPEECLFYTSWTGKTQSSAEATNSTERLFSDSKFQAHLGRVHKKIYESLIQVAVLRGLEVPQVGGGYYLRRHLHSNAGAFYISEAQLNRHLSPTVFGGLVVRVDNDESDSFVKYVEILIQSIPESFRSTVTIADSSFFKINFGDQLSPIIGGLHGNYWIAGWGEGEVEKILQRFEGTVPGWLVEAKATVATPRPASFAYLDLKKVRTIALGIGEARSVFLLDTLGVLGFDAMESLAFGSGLDQQGTVSRGLLKLSGELHGMLTLLDSEPLVAADLEPIDSNSPAALVFQLNLADALTAFLDSCEQGMAPEGAAAIAKDWRKNLEMASRMRGIDLQKDFLATIGDTWRIYAKPGHEALTQGWTLSVDLSNPAQFANVHDTLLKDFREKIGGARPVKIISQKNEQAVFHTAHINGFPFKPSWAVYEDRLWITTSIISAHRLLTSTAPEKSLVDSEQVGSFLQGDEQTIRLLLLHLDMGALMEVVFPLITQQLDILPEESLVNSSLLPPLKVLKPYLRPTAMAVERTEAGLEMTLHSTLPNVDLVQSMPFFAAAVLPAAQRARGAAERVQSLNQQKEILLAMLNFESAYGSFPAGYSADEEGKPLLSWRVHILPFLGEMALYEQFHLDEPWDSPHNKKLVERIPEVYRPTRSKADQGKTTCLGVGGADGVFVRPRQGSNLGIGLRNITDGTSNTAMMVDVTDDRAVTWTRPSDFAPQKKTPRQGLRTHGNKRIVLGFADGSVRRLPEKITDETFMKYFTKSGGEVIERP